MEHFNFKGFDPNESLRVKSYRSLDRIVNRAPSDANVIAVLEKNGELFHCSIEVVSSGFPFSVSMTHRFAEIAVDKAELAALKKLDRWCSSRFVRAESAPIRAPFRLAT